MNNTGMTPAELRVAREHLGLSGDALGAQLGVSGRTVRHWEEGKYQVPAGVAEEIGRLERETAGFVAGLAKEWSGQRSPVLATFRSDADYREADPRGTLPASWHRAAVARAREQVPGAGVVYAEPVTLPVIPQFSVTLFCQLLDALQGTLIDESVREDPRRFLLAEVADLLDDDSGETAYPDLLEAVRSWSPKQAAGVLHAVLNYREAVREGADHGAGLRAAGYVQMV